MHKPARLSPEQRARDRVWDREFASLGRAEVVRRLAALSDSRNGRTGPSGFEEWNRQIESDIEALAREIARKDLTSRAHH